MRRILFDQHGSYDLVHVVAVIPVPSQTKVAGATTVNPDTAKIHLHGGQAFSVSRPFDEVHSAWLAVKQAEGHPVETPSDADLQPELQQ